MQMKGSKSKILILGSYGLLGTELSTVLASLGYRVLRQGRGATADFQCEPSNMVDLQRLLKDTTPDVIVNLIATTNVDLCETNPTLAYLSNVRVVEAIIAANLGTTAHLVHISSDQVYNGPGPHDESNVCPCNTYGLTKYCSELIASKMPSTILRVNFVGRSRNSQRSSLADWIVNSLRRVQPITLFDDVLFNPLHMTSLCHAIDRVICLRHAGVFNVGSSQGVSKAQFGLELATQLGLDTKCVSIGKSADAPLKALRPLDMRMNVTRFHDSFHIATPTMRETIALVASEYANET